MRQKSPKCGHFILNESCIECAELFHYWNAKLEDHGFRDVELKSDMSYLPLLDKDVESQSAKIKAKYYDRMIKAFYNERFDNKAYEFVMERAASGKKICEIMSEYEQTGHSIHRETVRFIIRRFEHKWGIREWSLKQRHLKTPID